MIPVETSSTFPVEGAVETLECQECGGVGMLPIHRGWCSGTESRPEELISGWQDCPKCGGAA